MLIPVFSLKLGNKIVPRLVTVGKYDGVHPCLTGGTSGGKVFVHSPHSSSLTTKQGLSRVVGSSSTGPAKEVILLNIGQQISSVSAGILEGENALNSETSEDILLVGTQNNLLAYNVQQNADQFYKNLPDGANVIVIDSPHPTKPKLAYVGGNCSIQGFDGDGNDQFWTVTGDNVSSLAMIDFNLDGHKELIVGSEDYDLRVFSGDELVGEISEADAVTYLCPIDGGSLYAYALANGTVGVYNGLERLWRTKSKSQPITLFSYDVNDDGVNEVITGWSSGKVEARNDKTGEVVYKDTLDSAVAGIVKADYKMDGNEELICCSVEGEVRGYLPTSKKERSGFEDMAGDQEALSKLNQIKQSLLQELKNYDSSEQMMKAPETERATLTNKMGAIPAGTTLRTEFSVVLGSENLSVGPHLILSVQTNNKTSIKTVVVFAEGLFEGESYVVHPPLETMGAEVRIPFYPPKDVPQELNVKALVGYPMSDQFHVFEICRPLARFSLYVPCPLSAEPAPTSFVEFQLTERLPRIQSWLSQSFLFEPGEDMVTTPYLEVAYMSLRTQTPLILKFDPQNMGKVTLRTDDMDLAGDIVQSLAEFLGIEDLNVVADFPKHMEELKEVLVKVEEFQSVRERLSAQMAEDASFIRSWIIRAEDARLMENWSGMNKSYSQLYELNRDLVAGYKIRCNNHMELLDYLKVVNQAIQKAGRLRVGKAKAHIVSACRQAVKDNDIANLIKVMKYGPVASS